MNEHQHRLRKSMIDLMEIYLNNETQDFYRTVGKLEGALDASEIQDNDLINQWYDFWIPLETIFIDWIQIFQYNFDAKYMCEKP